MAVEPFRFSPWIFLLLLLAACATPPGGEDPSFDRARTMAAYLADQEARSQAGERFRLAGILDWEGDEVGGRARFTLLGEKGRHLRLSIQGPFRQTAYEVLVSPALLFLIDPGKRQVVRMAADAQGFTRLTGIALDPSHLERLLLGLAATEGQWQQQEFVTPDGERLHLDPEHGRLLSRLSQEYQTDYQWPEEATPHPWPAGLTIRLHGKREGLLKLEGLRWQTVAHWPGDPFFQQGMPAGFRLLTAEEEPLP